MSALPESVARTCAGAAVAWTRRVRGGVWVLGLGALLVLPWLLRGQVFTLRLFCQMFLATTVILGFVIILGFTKQFSLGQVAFYGIGAYTTAYLTAKLGVGFPLALAASGLAAGLAAVLVALPAARFQGPWLALVTFAFAEIIRVLMARLKPITGGAGGFYNIPRPVIAGWSLTGEFDYYFLFLALAAVAYAVTTRLRHSPYGRLWLTAGDNVDLAASLGIDVFRQRVLAFFIGSTLAGLAGGAFAAYATFVSPESFGLSHTIYYLTVLVVGGLESIHGAVLSAAFFTLSSNYLMQFHPWDLIVDGVIIVLFMNFLPKGIGGLLATLSGGAGGPDARIAPDAGRG